MQLTVRYVNPNYVFSFPARNLSSYAQKKTKAVLKLLCSGAFVAVQLRHTRTIIVFGSGRFVFLQTHSIVEEREVHVYQAAMGGTYISV